MFFGFEICFVFGQNTILMKEIGDKAAQGRACGNLGNVHYLLGNFSLAIHYHNERLKIAKEFGDKVNKKNLENLILIQKQINDKPFSSLMAFSMYEITKDLVYFVLQIFYFGEPKELNVNVL